MRFLVTHPPDPRPSVIAGTVARLDAAAIDAFKRELLRAGCPNGILFDTRDVVLIRDKFESLEVDSLTEAVRLSTDELLANVPAADLDDRVLAWLRSMSASWSDALPRKPEAAATFISDVVPAVSGSSVRPVA